MQVPMRAVVLMVAVTFAGCGGAGESPEASEAAAPGGLTAAQLEKGIGPVTELELAALDDALVARGQEVFTMKCSACHKPSSRYVGPALGDVTTRRTPEYVMNMILNPAEMVEKHPEAQKLLAEFLTPMPNQNLTRDDARAVLEYLRSLAGSPNQVTEE